MIDPVMEQRRRDAMYRMVVLFFIFTFLFDGNNMPNNRNRLRHGNGIVVSHPPTRNSDQIDRIHNLTFILNNEHGERFDLPSSLKLKGTWDPSTSSISESFNDTPGIVQVISAVLVNSNFTPSKSTFPLKSTTGGIIDLTLQSKIYHEIPGIQRVTGRINFMDGDAHTSRDFSTTINGFYVSKYKRLSLFSSFGFKSTHSGFQFPSSESISTPTSEPSTMNSKEDKHEKSLLHQALDRFKDDEPKPEDSQTKVNSTIRVWDSDIDLSLVVTRNTLRVPQYLMPSCYFRFDFDFSSAADELDSERNFQRLRLRGVVKSINCDKTLEMDLSAIQFDVETAQRKAAIFAWLEIALILMQIVFLLIQSAHTDTQASLMKVSMNCILYILVLDACESTMMLCSGLLHESLTNTFSFAAFLKLLLYAVFEMRYVVVIWKANMSQEDSWHLDTQHYREIYGRLYFVIFSALVCLYFFSSYYRILWMIAASYWLPQIHHNIRTESNDPFHTGFVVYYAVSRLVLPLYIHGYEHNFLSYLVPPEDASFYDPTLCWILITWTAMQVSLLMLQRWKGFDYIIPPQFKTPKYDYNRKIPEQLRDEDCVICMSSVTGVDSEHMLTPCNHLFHKDCLMQWTRHKLECPTCRAKLPRV